MISAAAESGDAWPQRFVDETFNKLGKIENWDPALTQLEFDARPNDESDAQNDDNENDDDSVSVASSHNFRKRKVRLLS